VLELLEARSLPSVVIASTNNNGQGYAALDFNHSGGYVPPDTCGAAGPTRYVETVNQTVALYGNKATGTPASLSSLSTFWFSTGGLPHAGAGSSLSDPIVTYNDQIGRFIVGDQDVNGNTHVSTFDIAVSKTSDPQALGTADWNFYQIVTTETGYNADYPGNFGYNHDAFVFTLNMFGPTFHVQVVSVDNGDLAAGVPQGSLHVFQNDINSASLRPTAMHDSVAGDPMWLVRDNGGSQIDVVKMTGVLSTTPSFSQTFLNVASHAGVVNPLNPNGTVITNNIDQRIMKAAEWNHLLVATHAVSISTTQDVAQWYAVNVGGATPTLQDQGRINAGANTYVIYPSIDINAAGQIGMTYMKSGTDTSTDYMSMYVTGRTSGDAAGTMETPVLVPAGTGLANYHDFSGGGRAGDLSGINVDPSDGTFWGANEFANTENTANWGTAVANFTLGTTLTINGTPGDDTITVHNLTGDPTSVEVIVNGASVFTGPWASLAGITIAASTGNDTVNVENDAAGVPIVVNLGNGTDVVNLSPVADNLGNLMAAVTVNGGGGADTLNVNDQATATAQSWTVASNSLTRSGAGSVSYGGISNLVVNGGGGNNTYTISGTQASAGTTLNTGAGTDTVNVQGTTAALTVNVQGGGGSDVVNVGLNNNLAGIHGALTINNASSPSHVNVNDTADGASHTAIALSAGSLTGLAPAAINFGAGSVNLLAINVGNGNNTYTIADVPASAGTTLNTGGGTDTVKVQGASNPLTVNSAFGSSVHAITLGSAANLLSGITAAVTVTAAANDTLALNDQGFAGARTFTVTASTVAWGGPTVTYSGLAALRINGGTDADTFNVSSTSATAALTIVGGSGNNTLVGPNADSTWNITATNAGTLVSGGTTTTFSGIKNLTGGSGADTFVVSDGAGVGGTIDGGGGSNTLDESAYTTAVTVNLQTNVLNMQTLIGGGGSNTLVGPNAATIWNITAQNAGTLTGGISFTAFQNLTGGSAADTFVLSDAVGVDGNIDGGGGSNTLNEAAYTTAVTVNLQTNTATGVGGTIANLQTVVGGGGSNTLVGPNPATTWNITANNAGTFTGGFSFTAFQNLTGGSAADIFVLSNGAGVSGNIDGGGGSNTLDESAYTTAVTVDLTANTATGVGGTIANLQSFIGGSGNNTLNGPAAATTWNLAGASAGTLTGGFSFSAFQNLGGGAGGNTFVFASGATVGGTITGGAGTNTLDYSAYTTSVIVDLQTGFATGVAGGVAGIANVNGANSSGAGLYNLLIGNGGNILTGGSGRRNLLVAGATASTLNAGTQEDLLIGGTTSYDTEAGLVSWTQIATYWAGSDPFSTRVNNVENGIGVPRLDSTTVTGNGGSNTMNGLGALALLYTDGADAISGFDPGSQTFIITP
jgi:hypothetical protein